MMQYMLLVQLAWLFGYARLCWLFITDIRARTVRVQSKKKYIYGVLFLSVITIVLVYCNYLRQSRWGMVTAQRLAIYIGPGNTYPIKSELTFLTDVCIRKRVALEKGRENWYYITSDEASGWVSAQAIREYRT